MFTFLLTSTYNLLEEFRTLSALLQIVKRREIIIRARGMGGGGKKGI